MKLSERTRLSAGDVAGRHALAGEARHVGLDHVQGRRRRCRGVEGVAAVAQHARAGRGGQRMGGGHHAVPRCDCRTLAVLQHMLSPPKARADRAVSRAGGQRQLR